MRHLIPLREVNQNFSNYMRVVEKGDEIIITRYGRPVARIVKIPSDKKSLTPEQEEARARLLTMMKTGLALGIGKIKRDELHDR